MSTPPALMIRRVRQLRHADRCKELRDRLLHEEQLLRRHLHAVEQMQAMRLGRTEFAGACGAEAAGDHLARRALLARADVLIVQQMQVVGATRQRALEAAGVRLQAEHDAMLARGRLDSAERFVSNAAEADERRRASKDELLGDEEAEALFSWKRERTRRRGLG